MRNILFICKANQFRSPLAAAHFKRRLLEFDQSNDWIVSSAGTWVKRLGHAHPAAIVSARKLALDISSHTTREVSVSMIELADLVLVMEQGHKEALQYEFTPYYEKIVLLSEIAGDGQDIPDPSMNLFEDANAIAMSLCMEIDRAFKKIYYVVSNSTFFDDRKSFRYKQQFLYQPK